MHKTTGAHDHISRAEMLALSQFATFCEEPWISTEDNQIDKLMSMNFPLLHLSVATVVGYVGTPHHERCELQLFLIADNYLIFSPLISDLVEWKKLDAPTFVTEEVDVPVQGTVQSRWRCTCKLEWCGQTFPRRTSGKLPALFINKKVILVQYILKK